MFSVKFDFSDQEWQRNVARVLMTVTSISSLGLNAFSAFNNVAYGNIQLFTERMAGEFFTTKSWKKASAIANKLPKKNKFITFHKIQKTFSKMNKLLEEFEFTSFNRYYKKKYE